MDKEKVFEISSALNFLIVDESDSFRMLISGELKKIGFKNIRQTSSAIQAVHILRNTPTDFIICERNMPTLDGYQLLKEVRESFEIPGMPFLMIGPESIITKEDVALLAEYDVDGYLAKPFTFKILSEKIAQCIEHYQNPNNVEFHIWNAKQDLVKKEYLTAITKFIKLLELIPESARIRVCLARCYREMGEINQAYEYCQQAIRRNNLYVQAYDELGHVCLAMGKIDDAINNFKYGINLSPNNPLRYSKVADIFIERERYKDAEILLKRALDACVVFDDLNQLYGKILYFLGKLNKAIIYLEKALLVDPKNKVVLNMMGVCLKELGKHEESLKYYNTALKYYPLDVKILTNKGLCLISLERNEQAKKVFETILQIDPTNKKAARKIEEIFGKLRKK